MKCHLVEITAMPDVRYSVTIGYLEAAAGQDPAVRDTWKFAHHVVHQGTGRGEQICAELIAEMDEPDVVPDVVAFTVYFWNRALSLKVARAIKQRWPGIRVVVGGNDVTHQAEPLFAEAPWVDVLVHGEGELRFPQILRAFAGDGTLEAIEGISFVGADGARVDTPAATRIADLDTIPSPLLSGVFSTADIAQSSMIVYETNRGCPYSCAFCFWGGATNSKVRQFSIERVREELEFVVANCHPGTVLFVADANFGIFGRDVEIAQHLVDLCARYNKKILVMTNWAKNTNSRVLDIATMLHGAGLTSAITLSAQSFDQNVLDIAHRSNIKLDRYRFMQAEFRKRGIPTYTDLIWGLPGETTQSFQNGIEECLASGGSPVMYPLVLLNNTDYTSDRFKDEFDLRTRRLPSDLSNLEMTADVVVAHRSMSEADWLWGIELRLAVCLYYKALLRATLWYVHDRTGIRFVDLLTKLRAHLFDECAGGDPVLSALVADYHANIADPDRVHSERACSIVGPSPIEEEIHYQAILRRYAGGATGEQLIRAAVDVLRAAVPADAIPDLDDVAGLDIAALNGVRARFRRTEPTATFDVPAHVWAMLVEAGQLPAEAGVASGARASGRLSVPPHAAQFRFTSYAVAVWHGSTHPLRDCAVELASAAPAKIAI